MLPSGPGAGSRRTWASAPATRVSSLNLWPTSWYDAVVRPPSPGHLGYEQDEPNDNALLYVWHGAIVPSPQCSRKVTECNPIVYWCGPGHKRVAAHKEALCLRLRAPRTRSVGREAWPSCGSAPAAWHHSPARFPPPAVPTARVTPPSRRSSPPERPAAWRRAAHRAWR